MLNKSVLIDLFKIRNPSGSEYGIFRYITRYLDEYLISVILRGTYTLIIVLQITIFSSMPI
jgi:hypothetical protein